MIYKINQNFQRLGVSRGTIQNTSTCYPVELSDSTSADTGIMLWPRQKISFSGATLYARCKGVGGAELRVVSFIAGNGGGTSSGGASGFVPAPAAGDNQKFLRGDGNWATTPKKPPKNF